MPRHYKILLAITALIALIKCSLSPMITDNESYYIQTIKWLNEYGYVKGVANLHIFLRQQSGWHLTQSVFNFSFLYKNFNDINGLLLIIANGFAFLNLSEFRKSKIQNFLIIGLLPLANVLLLQFVTAPSPDLPIYIITFIIVFYFIQELEIVESLHFSHIFLLCLFALFIKPTAVVLLLFPVILFIKNNKVLRHTPKLLVLSSAVFVLFVAKNFITSGHPFFPLTWTPIHVNFAVPDELAKLFFERTRIIGSDLSNAEFAALPLFDRFAAWLSLPGLHGLFNKIAIMLVFITPIFLRTKIRSRGWWLVYFVMLVQLFLLAITSPQYRFFLNFILLFGFVITAIIIQKFRILNVTLYLATAAAAIMLFVPINFNSSNKKVLPSQQFSAHNLLLPKPNSSLNSKFQLITDKKLKYYAPVDNDFFWETGDGPLPCVSRRQIQKFKKSYRFVPQPFSNSINDGFYSEQLQIIE